MLLDCVVVVCLMLFVAIVVYVLLLVCFLLFICNGFVVFVVFVVSCLWSFFVCKKVCVFVAVFVDVVFVNAALLPFVVDLGCA